MQRRLSSFMIRPTRLWFATQPRLPKLGCDPRPAITGRLQGNSLDFVPPIQVRIRMLVLRFVPIHAGAADLAQFADPQDRHRDAFLYPALDVLPGRPSMQCLHHPLLFDSLQAPLQKIDFQRLLADLALQLSDFRFIPPPLPLAGKGVAGTFSEFLPPTVQQSYRLRLLSRILPQCSERHS
jgi:hypothetical protein